MADQDQASFDKPKTGKKKKKKKPNFNKPFIVSGIFLGIVSGLPFVNLLNLVLFAWVWVAGFMAAKMLAKEFPYMQPAHGAVVGIFTAGIGALIAGILNVAYSVTLYKVAPETWAYWWPPGQLYMFGKEVLHFDIYGLFLKPYPDYIADCIYLDMASKVAPKGLAAKIVVHFLATEVAFCIFGAAAGAIGGVLFGKPAPKKDPYKGRKKSPGDRPKISVAPKPAAPPVAYAKPVLDDLPKAKVVAPERPESATPAKPPVDSPSEPPAGGDDAPPVSPSGPE